MNWAKKHVAVFASSKYELIHFINYIKRYKCDNSLIVPEHDEIKPTKTCRFLGVYLNP